MENQKSKAWDLLGGLFWKLGRTTAKPSPREIEIFLSPGDHKKICVIGASTKELIDEALRRLMRVTIVDFSAIMCRDLQDELQSPLLECRTADILEPLAADLAGQFDLVIAERLVNRFVHADCPRFFANAGRLLREGGLARISVKTGFYEMDLRLIEEGRRRGTLNHFFDPTDKTLDFARALDELRSIHVEHGSIPRAVLMRWYAGRGRESRFEVADLTNAVDRAAELFPDMVLQSIQDLPDAGSTVMLTLQHQKRTVATQACAELQAF